jgi:hypothetical protein
MVDRTARSKAVGRAACLALAASMVLGLSACGSQSGSNERPDFSGRWLPDPSRATDWPDPLPLTAEAREQMDAFVPDRRDPIAFCMPYGTPRNTLQTEFPLEILQTEDRITMIFQPDLSNAEVRRIRIGERANDEPPLPTWFGTSTGRWEGNTLVVETVAIDTDAIVSRQGLPHSEELRVVERLRIENGPNGKVLVDEMELHDPKAYTEPLKATRYFTWAPNVQFHESRCGDRLWIDKLWRDRLHEHAQARKQGGAKK